MKSSASLQLLACLIVYASSAHAIMVKFGTKDGPIEPPPPPVPSVPPQEPYQTPAPVWEERSNDTPDPNAHWRPPLFIPQPKYTQVIYSQQPPSYNNAQQFVNAYIPKQYKPISAGPVPNYFTPTQMVAQLSSQSLPGIGLRYFVPLYVGQQEAKIQEDAKLNDINSNEITNNNDSYNDNQWKLEKEAARRHTRESQGTQTPYVYQWPAYVHRQQ